MKINRAKAIEAFMAYTSCYDVSDDKIKLKIEHTNRVNGLCEQIAVGIGLQPEDIDLAWLMGLLHDVGRFEQIKQYGTFKDSESVDHANFGADILFAEGRIRDYIEESTEDRLLETAIRVHSAYRIPENFSERESMFCNILRDADKIDIIKVNTEYPLEKVYNVTTEDLETASVTPEVMESFREEHAVLRALKKTSVDNVVGHISLVYELVYPVSVQIMKEQGYLRKLTVFPSRNPKTMRQMQEIRMHLQSEGYL